MSRGLRYALLTLVLVSCASGPNFETEGVTTELSPTEAVPRFEAAKGAKVMWGGVIINSMNVKNGTRIEVLAFPLANNQQPKLDKSPLGRFLIFDERYLETLDYRQGRVVTVIGTLADLRPGKIGESTYNYPEVTTQRLYLWPEEMTGPAARTRVQVGVGVFIGN